MAFDKIVKYNKDGSIGSLEENSPKTYSQEGYLSPVSGGLPDESNTSLESTPQKHNTQESKILEADTGVNISNIQKIPEQPEKGVSSPPTLPVEYPKPKPLPQIPTLEEPSLPNPKRLGEFVGIPDQKINHFWKFFAIISLVLILSGASYLVYKSENGGLLPKGNESINISNDYNITLNPSISNPVTNNNNNEFKNNFTNEFNFRFDISDEFKEAICG